ncbi:DEAD/DEAH box helicase [Pseudooceanicola nitratireducens]|jgi:ATP-dependent RNA helicase RhlE|uniref:DEAD/DEAH box helicase n=1 Tax=Pseudooceanicola nitratireducens TaxID=517719 RepID=UPI001C93E215|nr:DEAD/DEAH box helicase [Pseudooceanicola nitratireducens]MBY6158266.1 DEAD/DEAH box helicase [Pseudooceanicola nitratireducens]MBY6165122.1 DEAD/DEAH box helicase [Pseudooceanicola nitratireducens]
MTFDQLGLRPALLSRIDERGLTAPTPIQTRAIPEALKGRDIMGLAQTGTGKTLAFGLPIADALMATSEKADPRTARALILAPTRELAKQISDNLRDILQGAHLRIGLVVGGASINAQAQRLERGAHILVATPGRLLDLLDRGSLSLAKTRYLVLDEADQMLDMGFIHDLRKIAKRLPEQRQTLLFSATMPKLMAEIAGAFLNDPLRIEVTPPGKTADKIDQSVVFVEPADKQAALINLLDEHREELALVFTRTKYGADKLAKKLIHAGFAVGAIHGNKSQGQRTRALNDFKSGELRVLVATDVAARGIDIPDVRHVYNFEMPNVADNYVHRIGRTARAGKDGRAVSLCSAEEMGELGDIEKVIGHQIETAGGTRPAPRNAPKSKSNRRRGGGGGGNGGGGRRGRPAGGGEAAKSAGKGPQNANGAKRPNRQRRRKGGAGSNAA